MYNIVVRDPADIACTDSINLTVNPGGSACDLSFTEIVTHESVLGKNDGKIEVTGNSSNPPFQFSKDGGQNYQGSNIFDNLDPDIYQIFVQDSSNPVCTVSKIIAINQGIIIFQDVFFSKNPIVFSSAATANKINDN